MKLNGWQRIGILVSLAWAISMAVHDRDTNNRTAYFSSRDVFQNCLDRSVELTLEAIADMSNAVFNCQNEEKREYKKISEANWERTAALSLLPIPIGWLVVYLIIWIFRWVKAGFKPENKV
jgi:hypothetical protein